MAGERSAIVLVDLTENKEIKIVGEVKIVLSKDDRDGSDDADEGDVQFIIQPSDEGHVIVPVVRPCLVDDVEVEQLAKLSHGCTILVDERYYRYIQKERPRRRLPPTPGVFVTPAPPQKPKRNTEDQVDGATSEEAPCPPVDWCVITRPTLDDELLRQLQTSEQVANLAGSYVSRQVMLNTDTMLSSQDMDKLFRFFQDEAAEHNARLLFDFILDYHQKQKALADSNMPNHSPVIWLLTELLKSSVDPDEHNLLWLRLLNTFSHFTQNLESFAKYRTAAVVMGSMAAHAKEKVVQEYSCYILSHLANYRPMPGQKVQLKESGVELIIRAMKTFPGEVSILRPSCRALANITAMVSSIVNQMISAGEVNQPIQDSIQFNMNLLDFIQQTCEEVVKATMVQHNDDLGIQTEGKRLLVYFDPTYDKGIYFLTRKWKGDLIQEADGDNQLDKQLKQENQDLDISEESQQNLSSVEDQNETAGEVILTQETQVSSSTILGENVDTLTETSHNYTDGAHIQKDSGDVVTERICALSSSENIDDVNVNESKDAHDMPGDDSLLEEPVGSDQTDDSGGPTVEMAEANNFVTSLDDRRELDVDSDVVDVSVHVEPQQTFTKEKMEEVTDVGQVEEVGTKLNVPRDDIGVQELSGPATFTVCEGRKSNDGIIPPDIDELEAEINATLAAESADDAEGQDFDEVDYRRQWGSVHYPDVAKLLAQRSPSMVAETSTEWTFHDLESNVQDRDVEVISKTTLSNPLNVPSLEALGVDHDLYSIQEGLEDEDGEMRNTGVTTKEGNSTAELVSNGHEYVCQVLGCRTQVLQYIMSHWKKSKYLTAMDSMNGPMDKLASNLKLPSNLANFLSSQPKDTVIAIFISIVEQISKNSYQRRPKLKEKVLILVEKLLQQELTTDQLITVCRGACAVVWSGRSSDTMQKVVNSLGKLGEGLLKSGVDHLAKHAVQELARTAQEFSR